MAAFESALKIDEVDGIECDIAWSRDGQYFALHDASLTRTMKNELMDSNLITNVTDVDVEDLDWPTIEKVPISSWGDRRVPLVQEILDVSYRNNKHVIWELKADNVKDVERRGEYVNGFADVIDSECSKKKDDDEKFAKWKPEDKMIFISFNIESLKILRARFPLNPIYFLIHFETDSDGSGSNEQLTPNDTEELDELIKLSKDSGLTGIESNYQAYSMVPDLQEKYLAAGLKAGIYVGPWEEDLSLTPVGDRSEDDHRIAHDKGFSMYTSNIPRNCVYIGCLWSGRSN